MENIETGDLIAEKCNLKQTNNVTVYNEVYLEQCPIHDFTIKLSNNEDIAQYILKEQIYHIYHMKHQK